MSDKDQAATTQPDADGAGGQAAGEAGGESGRPEAPQPESLESYYRRARREEAAAAARQAAGEGAGEGRGEGGDGGESEAGASEEGEGEGGDGGQADAAGAGEGGDEGEGAEGEVITTLTELAEQQQWDPDWVDDLKVNVKVNGEHSQVTMKDLVASYQTQQAADARLEKAKEQAAEITEDAQKRVQAIDGAYAVAAKLIERAEQYLQDDLSNADLQRLRREDPGEYSAKVADFEKRRQAIEALKSEAVESWRKGRDDLAAKTRQEVDQNLSQEVERLQEKIPEWGDQEKARQGIAKLTDYLVGDSMGFSREDVAQVKDHRLLVMAEKARRYDELQASGAGAVKKVAKVPRTMKPGPQGSSDRRRPKDPSEMTMDEYRAHRKKQGAPVR